MTDFVHITCLYIKKKYTRDSSSCWSFLDRKLVKLYNVYSNIPIDLVNSKSKIVSSYTICVLDGFLFKTNIG